MLHDYEDVHVIHKQYHDLDEIIESRGKDSHDKAFLLFYIR